MTNEKWLVLMEKKNLLFGAKQDVVTFSEFLQLNYPVVIAAIFVSGIGGTFQYGFCVSVMNSPSAVS